MHPATAVADAAGRSTPVVEVPLDLRTALHRAAVRLAHAANLAAICADGSMPERGAGYVLGAIAGLERELAVFRATIDAP